MASLERFWEFLERENVWGLAKGSPGVHELREKSNLTWEVCPGGLQNSGLRQGKKQTKKNVWGRTWKYRDASWLQTGDSRELRGNVWGGKWWERGEGGAISMKKAVWVYDAGWWQMPLKTWSSEGEWCNQAPAVRALVLRTSQKQVNDQLKPCPEYLTWWFRS